MPPEPPVTHGAGTAPALPGVGEIFAGRYEILSRLGAGGFGTVFRARDAHLRVDVALKVTHAATTDPVHLARFEREARLIAKLSHDNIVKVYDFGVVGATPYYAMELVEGETLESLMETNAWLAPRAAARIARDVALALHHAHLHGVTHRDVKPQNILVQARGGDSTSLRPARGPDESVSSSRGVLSDYRVVLTDFGLAKDRMAVTQLSVTGEVMGTPHYMSPEQALGEREAVGAASDVYSLGVVLYFLLSGRLPFEGDTTPAVLYQIVNAEPPALRRLAPHAPRDLCAVVGKAMEKDATLRYASALALAEDCERFLQGEPVAAKPPPLPVRARRFVRRHLALCASVGSTLLVGGALLLTFGRIAPAMRERAAREAFEARRGAFLSERARVEEGAARLLAEGGRLEAGGDFGGGAARAAEVLAQYERYGLARTFPFAEFRGRPDWDERLASEAPFRVPVVEAHLLAARARERAGQGPEATRDFLRATYADSERQGGSAAGGPGALYELAHHLLRGKDHEQAAAVFRRVVESRREPHADWAREGLAYALAGSGRHEEAAAAFRDLLARPLGSAPPPRAAFAEGAVLVPMHALPPDRALLEEAAGLCDLVSGRQDLGPIASGGALGVADLEGDGREEILVPVPDALEIHGWDGTSVSCLRTLAAPGLPRTGPTPCDFDGDGRPELVFPAGEGIEVRAVRGGALETLHAVTASPSRGCGQALAGDLDGDGLPELIMVDHQRLYVFRLGPGGYAPLPPIRTPSTDIASAQILDLDGDGRSELLLTTVTWGRDNGFRIWAYRLDPGAAAPAILAERPVGMCWIPPLRVPTPSARKGCSFVLGPCWTTDATRALRKRWEGYGLDPVAGLIRVTWSEGAFLPPEPLWVSPVSGSEGYEPMLRPVRRGGRDYILAQLGWLKERRLVSWDGDRGRYLNLGYDEDDLPGQPGRRGLTADLDGDGDSELVAAPAGRLVVTGLPGGRSDTAATRTTRPAPPDDRAAAYEDSGLAVSALLGRGRLEEALGLLGDTLERYPERRKEILLARARVLADARRWGDLEATLAEVRSLHALPGGEAREIETRWRGARDLLALEERVAVRFSDPTGATLLTDTPLKFRLDRAAGTLRAYSNSQSPAVLAIPARSGEAAQSVTARLRLLRADYVSYFGWGISNGVAGRSGKLASRVFADWGRSTSVWGAGSGDTPSLAYYVSVVAGVPAPGAHAHAVEALGPGPDWLVSSAVYGPAFGFHRGTLEREAPDGPRRLALLDQPWEARLPAQACALAIAAGQTTYVSDDYWGELELENLVVRSAGEFALAPFEPEGPRDLLLRAGGRFVSGDHRGALADWAAALGPEAGPPPVGYEPGALVGLETELARALAHLHLGERREAEARIEGILDRGLESALQVWKRNFLALGESERALFREVFRRREGGRDPRRLFRRALDILRPHPNGGLPAAEELALVGTPDPAEALAALAEEEETYRRYGGRSEALYHRARARLLREAGRGGESLAELRAGLEAIADKDVDEINRTPIRRGLEALQTEWGAK